MPRVLNQANLLKEMAAVDEKLTADKLTPEKRLVLLRRQAQLGDLRDAIAERARRSMT